jgi:dynein heavy chain
MSLFKRQKQITAALLAVGLCNSAKLTNERTVLNYLIKHILKYFLFKDHYDWGLRAIKSVLVVAGALKRADLELPEDQVRTFILPK